LFDVLSPVNPRKINKMSKASAITKNYAKALFLVAKQNNIIEKVDSNLEAFKKSFTQDFAHELQNPVISKSDLVKIMEEITQKFTFENVVSNFLFLLANNKRLSLFLEVQEEFTVLLKKQKNILEAEIIFANKSDKEQLDQIKAVIEKKYSDKTIEIKETLNPKILGGFQVRIGSNIVDASLKNQIFSLKQELIAANN